MFLDLSPQRGQAYVRVEAEISDGVSLMAVGSSGEITMGATISWEIPGGISGEYGWVKPSGRKLVPFFMDETLPAGEITANLQQAWEGAKGGHLNQIEWCVTYH